MIVSMKTTFFAIFSLVLISSIQAKIAESSVIETGWVDIQPIKSCPETHYPVSIELMPLKGDGVRYKMVFIPKPNERFEYKYAVSERTQRYRTLHSDYTKQGYVQICHQVVTVMSGNVHQAVWVRLVRRE